jgi:hypothetical protein
LYIFFSFIENLFAIKYCTRLKSTIFTAYEMGKKQDNPLRKEAMLKASKKTKKKNSSQRKI